MHHALEHVHDLPKAPAGNVHAVDLDQPIAQTDLAGALDGTQRPNAVFRGEPLPSRQDGQGGFLRRRGVRRAGGGQEDAQGSVCGMVRQVDGDYAADGCGVPSGGGAAAAPASAAASVTARHLGDVF